MPVNSTVPEPILVNAPPPMMLAATVKEVPESLLPNSTVAPAPATLISVAEPSEPAPMKPRVPSSIRTVPLKPTLLPVKVTEPLLRSDLTITPAPLMLPVYVHGVAASPSKIREAPARISTVPIPSARPEAARIAPALMVMSPA